MATLKKYKVLSAGGFNFGGNLIEKGSTFYAESKSSHITTAIHFKQVTVVSDKDEPKEPKDTKEPAK